MNIATDTPEKRRRGISSRFLDALSSPARISALFFACAIAISTSLLMLPIATASGEPAPWPIAFMVATSATTVTGLSPVDTGSYWSGFGLAVMLVSMKVGGLGVLTLASMFVVLVSRKMGIKQRLMASTDTKATRLGDVRAVVWTVIAVSTTTELVCAFILMLRFKHMGESLWQAAWHGLFYAVSAYNCAGFVAHPNGFPGDPTSDWWLCIPIMTTVVLGSLGVLTHLDMMTKRPRRWTLHTKLTVYTTALLTTAGFGVYAFLESLDLGALDNKPWDARILSAAFSSVSARTGGFNVLDMTKLDPATWWFTDMMMFIGGGSGSTAGGIKVSTLAVLGLAAWAHLRGSRDINVGKRRIPDGTVRAAVGVLISGALVVWSGTFALLALTDNVTLDQALFEVTSAFSTVGLSPGIDATLPTPAKLVVCAVMYTGRVGLLTLLTALMLKERRTLIRLPAERPIVG